MNKCMNCGSDVQSDANFCPVCGKPVSAADNSAQNAAQQNPVHNASIIPDTEPKSRLLAGVLGLLLGGLGIHNFYLGNTTRGVIQILVTCITCGIGAIWGFVEGILILCRQINSDGYGRPLKNDC